MRDATQAVQDIREKNSRKLCKNYLEIYIKRKKKLISFENCKLIYFGIFKKIKNENERTIGQKSWEEENVIFIVLASAGGGDGMNQFQILFLTK